MTDIFVVPQGESFHWGFSKSMCSYVLILLRNPQRWKIILMTHWGIWGRITPLGNIETIVVTMVLVMSPSCYVIPVYLNKNCPSLGIWSWLEIAKIFGKKFCPSLEYLDLWLDVAKIFAKKFLPQFGYLDLFLVILAHRDCQKKKVLGASFSQCYFKQPNLIFTFV